MILKSLFGIETIKSTFNQFKTAQSEFNELLQIEAFDSANIDDYVSSLDGLTLSQKKAIITTADLDDNQKKALITEVEKTAATNTATASTEGNSAANVKNSMTLKGVAASAKAAWASMSMLSKITLISAVIVGAITVIEKFHTSAEEAAEAIKEAYKEAKTEIDSINESFKTLKETTDDIKNRYAELAQGVDQSNGKNLSLTTDEYEEFLEISKQLAELFPSLERTYNENGNAILKLSGNVDTITSSIEGLISAQQRLANQEIIDNMPDVWAGYALDIKNYQKQIDETDIYSEFREYISGRNKFTTKDEDIDNFISNIMSELVQSDVISWTKMSNMHTAEFTSSNYNPQFKSATWDFSEFTEDEYDLILNKISEFENQYKGKIQQLENSIEAANVGMKNYINTWITSEWNFNNLDVPIQNVVRDVLLNGDWLDNLPDDVDSSNWDKVSAWLQNELLFAIRKIDNEEIETAMVEAFNNDLTIDSLENLIDDLVKIEGFDEDNPLILYIQTKIEEAQDKEDMFDSIVEQATGFKRGEAPYADHIYDYNEDKISSFFEENGIDTVDEYANFKKILLGTGNDIEEAFELYKQDFLTTEEELLSIPESIKQIADQLEPQFVLEHQDY